MALNCGMVVVYNRTRGIEIARRVRVADSSWTRLVGLLNRSRLERGEGLWIYPSSAIHTVGMRFAIDALFLGRGRGRVYRVVRIYRGLAPWRLTRLVRGAASVLELPAGVADESGTEVGDDLEFKRLA